jgi:hypothetical protein
MKNIKKVKFYDPELKQWVAVDFKKFIEEIEDKNYDPYLLSLIQQQVTIAYRAMKKWVENMWSYDIPS